MKGVRIYDPFEYRGVTLFRSPDPKTNLKRTLLEAIETVLDGLNLATGA
ncbi:MAG: hypothetical protein HWN66_05910 [Candidatus Helarchaeota archaeon]|nr:hypothetical protein [Candidatus Helarchaeota archaeon]